MQGAIVREREVKAKPSALRHVLGSEVELHAVDLVVCSAWLLDPVWLFYGMSLHFAMQLYSVQITADSSIGRSGGRSSAI